MIRFCGGVLLERFHKVFGEAEGNAEDPIRKKAIEEAAEAMSRAQYAHEMAKGQFWLDVNERFKTWVYNVGVRDNYALVKIKDGGIHNVLRQIFGGM